MRCTRKQKALAELARAVSHASPGKRSRVAVTTGVGAVAIEVGI